ncbi:hypothetical protein ACFT0G_31265 [Streptomyces sp. NPDC057020]|uniref:hypothetical protein n=1 Tax=unclassified Streptomyces TaxID=2593676 RepID=UPI00362535F7
MAAPGTVAVRWRRCTDSCTYASIALAVQEVTERKKKGALLDLGLMRRTTSWRPG